MWIYEKKLEFPVKITKPDARLAKIMIEQYGGADGELGASLRYLSQKFTMVTPEAKATLNDIATEETGLSGEKQLLLQQEGQSNADSTTYAGFSRRCGVFREGAEQVSEGKAV